VGLRADLESACKYPEICFNTALSEKGRGEFVGSADIPRGRERKKGRAVFYVALGWKIYLPFFCIFVWGEWSEGSETSQANRSKFGTLPMLPGIKAQAYCTIEFFTVNLVPVKQ
jgi:hypothetical protein